MTEDQDARAAMSPAELTLYEVLAARADSAETCLYFCRKELRRMRANARARLKRRLAR